MKKIIFTINIAFITICANAQQLKVEDVPYSVKSNFSLIYPNVINVKWEIENGMYEAEFYQNNVETSVLFGANGTFVRKELEILTSELPEEVKKYASENLPGKKINEASVITDANGVVTYEAEIGNKDFVFDQYGIFLKKESDENDGSEDDDGK